MSRDMLPTELREALSSLGKTAIQFDLSEMHDTAEVCIAHNFGV